MVFKIAIGWFVFMYGAAIIMVIRERIENNEGTDFLWNCYFYLCGF